MLLMPSVFRNNLFDDFFDDFDRPVKRVQGPQTQLMRTDVKETENSYELDVELPGVKKEDVKAQLEDGYLKISAEHSEETEKKDDDGKYLRKERHCGKLQRNFYVGPRIQKEGIKASFENGVLALTVQKENEEQKKEIIDIL